MDSSRRFCPIIPAASHHGNMGYANLTDGFNEASFITGQVPGGEPMELESGMGYRIPKGSVLGVATSFHRHGKAGDVSHLRRAQVPLPRM